MFPDQSQAIKVVNNSEAFTLGRAKNEPFFFLDERLPAPGAPGHVGTMFRVNTYSFQEMIGQDQYQVKFNARHRMHTKTK